MAIATATLIPQFNTQNLHPVYLKRLTAFLYVRALLARHSKPLPELFPALPRLDTAH